MISPALDRDKAARLTESEVVRESVRRLALLFELTGNASRVLHRTSPASQLIDEVRSHSEPRRS